MTALDLRPALSEREGFPLYPPRAWFEEMPEWFSPGDKLSFQTTGPDAGRVAATVAPRDQCILDGTSTCWTAPFSPTKYAAAHQGDTLTEDGALIHTANLMAGVNHARLSAGFREVAKRAENTGTQIARVQYHDLPGHVVALGALWPDITEAQLAIARASALSGDWRWRPELGDYDMAEAILVNNPGFPLMRRAAALIDLDTGEELGASVYVGGMGGIGDFDDELDACPQCAALTERVIDLERVLSGLRITGDVQEIAAMLEGTIAQAALVPTLLARIGALEESRTAAGTRAGEVEEVLGQVVAAVGAAPRHLHVERDADKLVTDIYEVFD